MFDHALDALKGFIEEYALDFKGRLHGDVTVVVPAGSVVYVYDWEALGSITNPAAPMDKLGLFKTGTPKQSGNPVMGIFLWQNSDDFDVANDGGNPATDARWYGVLPARRGVLNGLVASGPFELQTTEYDSTKTYGPNTKLYGEPNDTNATLGWAGRITTDSDSGNRTVCGIVSRGLATNYNEVNVLTFWSVFIG
jgi:hypothetical protein